jgi:hypothetical protein
MTSASSNSLLPDECASMWSSKSCLKLDSKGELRGLSFPSWKPSPMPSLQQKKRTPPPLDKCSSNVSASRADAELHLACAINTHQHTHSPSWLQLADIGWQLTKSKRRRHSIMISQRSQRAKRVHLCFKMDRSRRLINYAAGDTLKCTLIGCISIIRIIKHC